MTGAAGIGVRRSTPSVSSNRPLVENPTAHGAFLRDDGRRVFSCAALALLLCLTYGPTDQWPPRGGACYRRSFASPRHFIPTASFESCSISHISSQVIFACVLLCATCKADQESICSMCSSCRPLYPVCGTIPSLLWDRRAPWSISGRIRSCRCSVLGRYFIVCNCSSA